MVYLFSVERLTRNNLLSIALPSSTLRASQQASHVEQVARDNIDLRENQFYSTDWIYEEDRRFIQHQLNTVVEEALPTMVTITNVITSNNDSRMNVSFPGTNIIERLFRDYLENKDKISISEFNDSTIKLDDKIDECPICYNSFEKSIKIKKCEHTFCETCITKWLLDNKYTCPTCRIDVRQ